VRLRVRLRVRVRVRVSRVTERPVYGKSME
jgi:hypothetical protein